MATNYPPTSLPAYRADAEKPGKLETQSNSANYPANWALRNVYDIGTALQAAMAAGMPKVSPEALVTKMLVEGRSDAGTNRYDYNNKQAKALFTKLENQGYPETAATFAAATLANAQTAKRLGKSEAEIWNGTGTSSAGKTGADYAKRMAASNFAATEPKNAQLLDYVTRAALGKLTTQEHLTQLLPAAERQRTGLTGDLTDAYARLAWTADTNNSQENAVINALSGLAKIPGSHISNVTMAAQRAGLNSYRKDLSMPPIDANRYSTATDATVADILAELPIFKKMLSRLTPGGTSQ